MQLPSGERGTEILHFSGWAKAEQRRSAKPWVRAAEFPSRNQHLS